MPKSYSLVFNIVYTQLKTPRMDNKTAEELKPYESMIDNLLLALPMNEVFPFMEALAKRYSKAELAKEEVVACATITATVSAERTEDGVKINRYIAGAGMPIICAGIISEIIETLPEFSRALLKKVIEMETEFDYLAALVVGALENKMTTGKRAESAQEAEAK